MRAAVVGRVDGVDVARRDLALVLADDGFDRAVHGAEMHRHVRRVGDERGVGGEHRAGEVQPLLDVDRIGGVLQRHAHLLGDRHEQIVEYLEHHRVGGGADRALPFERHDALEQKVVLGGDFGLPAVLDDNRLVRLDDDGGTAHRLAGRKLLPRKHRGLLPLAARIKSSPACGRGKGSACRREHRLGELGAAADCLDRDRLDHQLLALVDEAKPRLVRGLEGGLHLREGRGNRDIESRRCWSRTRGVPRCDGERRHHQCSVRAGITDMRAHEDFDRWRGDALIHHFTPRLVRQRAADALDRGERGFSEWLLDRVLARGADVGEAHAVGGEERREWVDQYLGHAERVGNETGMLPAGAAETIERVTGHVVTALHRDFLDRVRHVLDRDLDEAVGDLLARAADFAGELRKGFAHCLVVERLLLRRSENLRKELRHELADHDVGVGERERAAAAIAFRARIGAGAVRSDAEASAVEVQDRAATRCHCMDQHHRRTHAHAGDLGLECALVIAVEMRDVGRGTSHVEADEVREASLASGLRHADHPRRRSRQNRVLALKQFRRGQSAGRHHEHQPGVGIVAISGNGSTHVARHLRHVSPQDR